MVDDSPFIRRHPIHLRAPFASQIPTSKISTMALSVERAYTIIMLCPGKDILNKFVEGHHCKKLASDYPVHTIFFPNLL